MVSSLWLKLYLSHVLYLKKLSCTFIQLSVSHAKRYISSTLRLFQLIWSQQKVYFHSPLFQLLEEYEELVITTNVRSQGEKKNANCPFTGVFTQIHLWTTTKISEKIAEKSSQKIDISPG